MKVEFTNLDKVIQQLNSYAKKIKQKENEFLKDIGKYGVTRVELNLNNAKNRDNDKPISYRWYTEGNQVIIEAHGEQIAFLEFGAGVHYNRNNNYPLDLPKGIVGIGEYGLGNGKKEQWVYYNDKGQFITTHGTKASHAIFNSMQEIINYVLEKREEIMK